MQHMNMESRSAPSTSPSNIGHGHGSNFSLRLFTVSYFRFLTDYISSIPTRKPQVFLPLLVTTISILWYYGIIEVILSWILIIAIIIFSIVSGLALVLCHGNHRVLPTPRPSVQQQQVSKFLERLTKNYNRHYYQHRIVISRQMDKTLQEVFDLIIRDFCLYWFRDVGRDETAFVEILNKEFWTITENLIERLRNVDMVNLLANDIVTRLCTHFNDLRLSDAGQFPGQTSPFLLHPSLKDPESEINYLRSFSEAFIYCILPPTDADCGALRYILREILASFVLLPTANSICDPDYINQTLVIYLEDREKITEAHKQQYAYAETYEDFVKLINVTTDVETLKQIRYHTIAEIMQATVIHNMKGIDRQDGTEKETKQNKRESLRTRNLKRYINQCRVAKSQCEKRIRFFGGPDYRAFGLGHGQPFEGTGKHGKKLKRTNTNKLLSFSQIMDNSLARSYFLLFLQKNHSKNLLEFWMAVENLRIVKPSELLKTANVIFQEYVTPSAAKVVKLDTWLVRGMENFLYGTGGDEYFFKAQKSVCRVMEEKYYRDFVLSQHYTEYVCQSESAIDELRAHIGDEDTLLIDWSSGLNFGERHGKEAWKASIPSSIEEGNDYAVRKLQVLERNLAAKTQALELSKRAMPTDPQEVAMLEKEVYQLITERRQLEFHIERTDLWCEMLGHWRAQISNVQLDSEDEKLPLFVICISCDEAADKLVEQGAHATGWVVVRNLKDFQDLHEKLRECCDWMSKEIPVSAKKWFFQKYDAATLEGLRISLQDYLKILLDDERLSQSEKLYTFLSPSSEHLRRQAVSSGGSSTPGSTSAQQDKKPFSIVSTLKGSLQNMPFPELLSDSIEDADEIDAGIEEESVTERKDSIAEPLYAFIAEVFELKGVFKYLRRTLITFVQVTFGGTINRHVREIVEWLVSETMLIYYINNFKDSFWPKGKLAPPYPMRSDLEKLRTREKAKEKMMKNIPDVLSNLVGKRNSRLGFIKLFEVFQDIRTTKHLFFILLELILVTLCPELKSDEVLQEIKRKQGKTVDSERDGER